MEFKLSVERQTSQARFTEEDESLLIKLHSALGDRWSIIVCCFPTKTVVDIKKHWGTSEMQQKLMKYELENQRRTINFFGLPSIDDESASASLDASVEHEHVGIVENNNAGRGEVDLELKL